MECGQKLLSILPDIGKERRRVLRNTGWVDKYNVMPHVHIRPLTEQHNIMTLYKTFHVMLHRQ